MSFLSRKSFCITLAATAAASLAGAQTATTFSIVDGGATWLTPDCNGNAITGASILRPSTVDGMPALAAPTPPCVAIPHAGAVSLHVPVGSPNVELDALSYGLDAWLLGVNPAGSVLFSVDGLAQGIPFPAVVSPSVQSEAPCGDEAASAYIDTGLPVLPPPVASWWPPRRNVEAIDGNGLASCSGFTEPGLGVVEPHLPGMGVIGDDVDALDVGFVGPRVYFSLEGMLADPCGGVGTGSAAANGFSPSAIVVTNLIGAPIVWTPPAMLGLDLAGFGTDDLDALAIWENGNGQYDPAGAPFDWLGGTDMVLFSVRRGSFVIGQPDNLFGQPIEEGDVLMPPMPGGMSPFPAILIPAEQLGLATRRSGTAPMCGNFPHADDLDALDVLDALLFDCDGNGVEDALDALSASGVDANHNGVPDSCECGVVVAYCTAGVSANGCTATMSASGTPSASAPNGFVLTTSGIEGQKAALHFYGVNGSLAAPWGAGSSSFLCVKAPLKRLAAQSSGGTAGACNGALTLDFNAFLTANPTALGSPFAAGDTFWVQTWYRDPPSPKTTSLSDALTFSLCP